MEKFDLQQFGEDLAPILKKHNLTGIVGMVFREGNSLNTFQFAERGCSEAIESCNAVYDVLDQILTMAGMNVTDSGQATVGLKD